MTQVLNSRYTVEKLLAEGGESIVYLAQDEQTKKTVVIKRSKHSISLERQQKWKQEIKYLQELRLDSVIPVLDSFIHTQDMVSYGFIVQEYIEGETLEQAFEDRRFTQSELLGYIREALKIVSQLQSLSPPVIHRDIKPSNFIQRKGDGKLFLLDFGIATDHSFREFGYTLGAGTIGYQSPEQLEGDPTLNSDVYSIAVMALQFLTRKKPHTLLLGRELQWRSEVAFLHSDWKEWLEKALCPTERRFSNAKEALHHLQKEDFGEDKAFSFSSRWDQSSTQKTNKEPAFSSASSQVENTQPQKTQAKNKQAPPVKEVEFAEAQPVQTMERIIHQPEFLKNAEVHSKESNDDLEQDYKKASNHLLMAFFSFFFFGFFAIPFIIHFYNKKKALERRRG